MSTIDRRQRLDQTTESEVPVTIKHAGVAGAGGAGFPTHAKWERLEDVDHLLVNHQESEPNYFMDKWLGQAYADELATLFDVFLDDLLETVVIGAKAKDREAWMGALESVTDGTVYMPEDLPIDPSTESGVVFAYTEDEYEYGMEQVLLRFVANVIIGGVTAGSSRTRRPSTTSIKRSWMELRSRVSTSISRETMWSIGSWRSQSERQPLFS